MLAEVGVAQFRRELREWLERARSGDEVVITERGRPVARLSGIEVASLLDRLTEEGLISAPPRTPRPPRARPPASRRNWRRGRPGRG
jgi:prevent-host-death family protein